jgi:hypothetical protein
MNELTRTGNGGSLVEVPTMSEPLHRCVSRTRAVARFLGAEDDRQESDFMPAWIEPKWVSESLRDEAEQMLPFYERLAFTTGDQSLLRWLSMLWTALPKARDTATDWEAVKLAYVGMLSDFPAICFSKRTMRAARDKFRWFPSAHDLAEFLTPFRNEVTNTVFRLRVIAHTTTQRPKPEEERREKPSEEEQRRVREIVGRIDAEEPRVSRAVMRGGKP